MITAAIDFGTTNSVAAININGKIITVPLSKDTLETKSVLFFSFEDKRFYVGDNALDELKADNFGRYLVSLKSFLGNDENITTVLGTNSYSLSDLIGIILKYIKNILEKHIDQNIERVVLGRPVHFNDTDSLLDDLAQNRLKEAAIKAGFKEIFFQYEPVAAALTYEKTVTKEETVLVVDIGGGTTDYTIMKVGKTKKREILATNGCYIGGDSFDSQIIKNFIIHHLGFDSKYINMGKQMQIGYSLYSNLSHWHKFQKMYDQKVIKNIENLIYMSLEKEKISRLLELIKHSLYFKFSQKIIESKMELSLNKQSNINMDIFDIPFNQELTQDRFNKVITDEINNIKTTLDKTLSIANLKYNQIDKVFLTGGSTLVPAVNNIYKELFSQNKIIHTDLFSSVGYGLAIYASEI